MAAEPVRPLHRDASAWRSRLDDADFDYLNRLLREQTGNALGDERRPGAEARLWNTARSLGFESISAAVREQRTSRQSGLTESIVEALLNGETLFFRDVQFFKTLGERLLPELMQRNEASRELCFWSAACASGQEPYSLAMTTADQPGLADWRVRIIASDLSSARLEIARAGRYTQTEINRGLPARLLVRHFEESGNCWQLADDIRRRVEFRQLNLISPWPALPPMDAIFIRNILIYFERSAKASVLERARDLLRPGGILALGGSESNLEGVAGLERIDIPGIAGCYRRTDQGEVRAIGR